MTLEATQVSETLSPIFPFATKNSKLKLLQTEGEVHTERQRQAHTWQEDE